MLTQTVPRLAVDVQLATSNFERQAEVTKTRIRGIGREAANASKYMDNMVGQRATRGLGSLGNRATQVSYQLQDMAVQAQNGTSGFVILGQQGSQLASAFGPKGVVLGAIVALASAIGGTLVASMLAAGKASEEMEKRVTDSVEGTLRVRIRKTDELIAAQKEKLRLLKEEIATSVESSKLFDTDSLAEKAGLRRNKLQDREIARLEALNRGRAYSDQIAAQINERLEARPGLIQEQKDLEEAINDTLKKREELENKSAELKSGGKEGKSLLNEIERIRKDGLTRIELEKETYQTRMDLITQFRESGLANSEKFNELEKREAARHHQALADIELAELSRLDAEKKQRRLEAEKERAATRNELIAGANNFESIRASLLSAEQAEKESHERRLAQIRTFAEQNTEMRFFAQRVIEEEKERHEKALTEIEKAESEKRARIDREEQAKKFSVARQTFGNLATLMGSNSKKLFKIGKLAAYSEAIVNTAQGVTEALALGPIGIPLAASIAAAGAIQLATIKKQQFGGGGTVSSASVPATSGSSLPSIPSTPTVSSAATAAPAASVVVDIKNYESQDTSATARQTENGIEVIVKRITRQTLHEDLSNGVGVARDIEGTYGLQRSTI